MNFYSKCLHYYNTANFSLGIFLFLVCFVSNKSEPQTK